MGTALRNALIISVIIHFIIITPLYGFSIFRDAACASKPIVVDYVVFSELPKPDIRRDQPDGAGKAAVRKNTRATARNTQPNNAARGRHGIADTAEAKIRSTKGYIDYYQLIRDSIYSRLKEHYKKCREKGEVLLLFTLRADGSLLSVQVDEPNSTNNTVLFDIAVRSVREAAPFPHFPKAISLPKMRFDLLVTFK